MFSIKIIIKLIVQVINIILIFITFNSRTTCNSFIGKIIRKCLESRNQIQREEYKIDLTFDAFVSGLTLWAGLIPFTPLVLIARPANGESTLIASNKGLPIDSNLNLIPTNLTYLSTQLSDRLNLRRTKPRKPELNVICT